jgi:hypothetical protein
LQLYLNRGFGRRRQTARLVAGLLLVGLFLLGQALAASALLHEWLHEDAANPTHVCAVTVLSHSQTEAPMLAVSAPSPASCTTAVEPPRFLLLLPPAFLLLPERAPPSAA